MTSSSRFLHSAILQICIRLRIRLGNSDFNFRFPFPHRPPSKLSSPNEAGSEAPLRSPRASRRRSRKPPLAVRCGGAAPRCQAADRSALERHRSPALACSDGRGANYAGARGAESRQDFVHKLRIADKETRESQYWLTLVAARWDEYGREAGELSLEADELVAILTASVRTAVARSRS